MALNLDIPPGQVRRFGDFHVRATAPAATPYPMRGGQGHYRPTDVLLKWTTHDGHTWTFERAVISGPPIYERTGHAMPHDTHQMIYLNDSGYRECEPVWLADMVAAMTPGCPAVLASETVTPQ